MGYYDAADLPFLYWLGQHFAVSDRHFSSVMGPAWPNRLFSFAATSCGFTEGSDTNQNVTYQCGRTAKSLFTLLDDVPQSALPAPDNAPYELFDASSLASVAIMTGVYKKYPLTIQAFKDAAKGNTLPAVSFVGAMDTNILHTQNDDHPPVNPQLGEQFLYDVVTALKANPDTFDQSVLFITHDEHGGFYDHVVPPKACEPEPSTETYDYKFDRYGFRVPFVVVSPHVSPGYVSRYITDHTSILRFIEYWLDLPALSARDANAWPLLDFFDFSENFTEALPDPSMVALAPEGVSRCAANPDGENGLPEDYAAQ